MTLSSASLSAATTVPAAVWFSAGSKAAEEVKDGAVLPAVREPSTLWPDCVPRPLGQASGTSVVVSLNSISSSESSVTGPTRLLKSLPSSRKMPLSSSSPDATV